MCKLSTLIERSKTIIDNNHGELEAHEFYDLIKEDLTSVISIHDLIDTLENLKIAYKVYNKGKYYISKKNVLEFYYSKREPSTV